jgi:hypothetical protein
MPASLPTTRATAMPAKTAVAPGGRSMPAWKVMPAFASANRGSTTKADTGATCSS